MTEAFREQLEALYAWSNGEHGGNEPTAMQIEERVLVLTHWLQVTLYRTLFHAGYAVR